MTEFERESVEAYVKDHIAEWLEASHPSPAERRLDLIETMQWMMFFGFALIGSMVTVYRFLGAAG